MIVDRYLGRNVLAATALTLLVLVALTSLFAFVGEMEDVGKGGYGVMAATLYVVFLLPAAVYEFLPVAVLIGAMLGLGMLASGNELTAMQAGGISIARLARAVLQTGLLLAVLALVLGELVVPAATERAVTVRVEARSGGLSMLERSGFWARDGDRFIRVGRAVPEARLEDVSVYEFDGDRLRRATVAASATYVDGRWRLLDVRETRWTPDGVRASTSRETFWPRLLDRSLVGLVEIDPESMSARALWRYARYLRANGLESARYELAFWQKVSAPLVPLVMLLLALPFVFGSLRSTGAGQRLLVGIMLAIGFYVTNRAVAQAGLAYGIHPPVAAAAPLAVFLVAGLLLLRRTTLR